MNSPEYERGWDAAFDLIADYVEEEICLITASMIRRMKYDKWRFEKQNKEETNDRTNT